MTGGLRYYYTTVAPPPRHRVTTSRTEILQIGIAYLVLTVDLVIIFSASSPIFGGGGSALVGAFTSSIVAVAAVAAFTGFLAHELAHKVVAQRGGFWAEFRMWPSGLALSFVVAILTGFLWGAPGATVVSGMSEYDRRNWGRTGLAGPLTNVTFGLAFFLTGVIAFEEGIGLVAAYWIFMLAWINGWFGTFNLIPAGPLDGRKVIRWSIPVWAGAIVFTGVVAGVSILAAYSVAYYGNPFHYYHAIAAAL